MTSNKELFLLWKLCYLKLKDYLRYDEEKLKELEQIRTGYLNSREVSRVSETDTTPTRTPENTRALGLVGRLADVSGKIDPKLRWDEEIDVSMIPF